MVCDQKKKRISLKQIFLKYFLFAKPFSYKDTNLKKHRSLTLESSSVARHLYQVLFLIPSATYLSAQQITCYDFGNQ